MELDTDVDGLIESEPGSGTAWVSFYTPGSNVLAWKYAGSTRLVDESTIALAGNAVVTTVLAPADARAVPVMGLPGLVLLCVLIGVFVRRQVRE